MGGLFSEIRRRNVVQAIIAYAVAGWLVIQLAIALEASLELPAYVDRWTTMAVLGGFPIALLLSWIFDISLDGIRLTPKVQEAEPQPIFPENVLANRAPTTKKSIAVLPFADMSQTGDQEYFADGISEEILNALVKVTELKVAGRTSSFAFKGKQEDIRGIGETLGVAHVLEGSVRKQGDKVRITAQLIQASDGFHLWSDTYDGELVDIFDLQDKISKAIVDELQIVLDAALQPRLATNMTNSPEAYEYFLRARPLVHNMAGQETLPKAVELLEKAVGLDPNFAEAWSWLADAHYSLPDQSRTFKYDYHFERGRQAVVRSLELDPERPQAYHAAGYRASTERRVDKIVDAWKQGYEVDPNDAEIKTAYGVGLNALGLFDKGLPLIKEGLAQEPLMPNHSVLLGLGQWCVGEAEAAGHTLDRAFELGSPEALWQEAYRRSNVISAGAAIDYLQAGRPRLPPVQTQYFILPMTWTMMHLACYRKMGFFRWVLGLAMPWLTRLRIATPSYVSINAYIFFGSPPGFFRAVRRYTTANLYPFTTMLFLPTEEARRIRTHKKFPKFAEEIGLVKAWQTHGWPPQIQPKPGTDGSNLQFTCS